MLGSPAASSTVVLLSAVKASPRQYADVVPLGPKYPTRWLSKNDMVAPRACVSVVVGGGKIEG